MREFEIKQARIAIEILGSFKDPGSGSKRRRPRERTLRGFPSATMGFDRV